MNSDSRRQKLVSEINITPFTDVILVLLIIFMIMTPLISQSNIKVKLPEAKSGKPLEVGKKSQVNISINNDGVVYLEEKPIAKKDLKEKIRSLQKNNPEVSVILRSDRMVPFKEVVSILDILAELEIKNLNIAAVSE